MKNDKNYICPNNIIFLNKHEAIGEAQFHTNKKTILVVANMNSNYDSNNFKLLIIDARNRYLASTNFENNNSTLEFSTKNISSIERPLLVYAYWKNRNVAFPITLIDKTNMNLKVHTNNIPSFINSYTEILIESLKVDYMAVSCFKGLQTGSGYQSIDLDDLITQGGRIRRNIFFENVNFENKTVLDLGANTGELSRLSRLKGAKLVDGYEYDSLFVETGRLINALTGSTRVSLFQGDITNPVIYSKKKYDIVLAFSVWIYIDKVLDSLAKVTNVVFFETHTLDHGIGAYIDPITKFFPNFQVLGYDENINPKKSRAVLVFSKTKSQLNSTINTQKLILKPYHKGLEEFLNKHGILGKKEFDVRTSELYNNLIKTDYLNIINGVNLGYYELFLAGWYQYKNTGSIVKEDNIFYQGFVKAIKNKKIDTQLIKLLEKDSELIKEKVKSRYIIIDYLLEELEYMIPPIKLGELVSDSDDTSLHFTYSDGKTIYVNNIDGHHRFFSSLVVGNKNIPVLVNTIMASNEKIKINTKYRVPIGNTAKSKV